MARPDMTYKLEKEIKDNTIILLSHFVISYFLKMFSAVFFEHPIAQVFRSLKTQGLRV